MVCPSGDQKKATTLPSSSVRTSPVVASTVWSGPDGMGAGGSVAAFGVMKARVPRCRVEGERGGAIDRDLLTDRPIACLDHQFVAVPWSIARGGDVSA